MALTDITKKAWTAAKRAAGIGLAYAMLCPGPMLSKSTECTNQDTKPQASQEDAQSNKRIEIPVYYQAEYVFEERNGKLDLVKRISADIENAYRLRTDRVFAVRATKDTRVDYWRKNEIWTYINENGKQVAMSADQIEAASIAIMKILNGAKFNEKRIKPGDPICFYDADGNDIVHVDQYFLNAEAIQATPAVILIKNKGDNNITYSDHEKIINSLVNRNGTIYFVNGENLIKIREQEAIKLNPEHVWIRVSEFRKRE